jgi:hypothetical protein
MNRLPTPGSTAGILRLDGTSLFKTAHFRAGHRMIQNRPRRNEPIWLPLSIDIQGVEMGNNKDSNKTRPGEMPPGKFHFNPGNMSGKKIGNAERHEDDVAVPADQAGKQKQPKETK